MAKDDGVSVLSEFDDHVSEPGTPHSASLSHFPQRFHIDGQVLSKLYMLGSDLMSDVSLDESPSWIRTNALKMRLQFWDLSKEEDYFEEVLVRWRARSRLY